MLELQEKVEAVVVGTALEGKVRVRGKEPSKRASSGIAYKHAVFEALLTHTIH